MQNFKTLEVWKKAHLLVKAIYLNSANFPSHELFGITSQLKRAAVSIPTNIAEGSGKGSNPDFARFLQISFGSCCEVEYLLLLCFELSYLDETDYNELNFINEEVKKMLAGLLKKIRA